MAPHRVSRARPSRTSIGPCRWSATSFGKPRSARTPDAAPTSRRRLLWEIWDGYHCSICGTCLSFAELGRIAAKAGLQFESDESRARDSRTLRADRFEAGTHSEAHPEGPGPEVPERDRTIPPREIRSTGRGDLESCPGGRRRTRALLGAHDASPIHAAPDDAGIRRGPHALAFWPARRTVRTFGGCGRSKASGRS